MKNYYDKLDNKVKEYYKVLSKEFPEWLNEYINTKELLKQQYISVTCGKIYSKMFDYPYNYNSLDHSIAVALIIWHFTHDKKQTLSGLFHDIATPAFKHCIDFLNGDYMVQESTEDLTTYIIEHSPEIMSLLKRDNIKLDEVDNYHIYPIADNDTPKLSSDRLEYSLSNALFIFNLIDIEAVREFYNDIEIQKNEEGIDELGFKTKKIARSFVKLTSTLSMLYRDDRTIYSMQLIADILKRLNEEGKIHKKDLYELKETDIIKIIEDSKYKTIFDIWKNAKDVQVTKEKPQTNINSTKFVTKEAQTIKEKAQDSNQLKDMKNGNINDRNTNDKLSSQNIYYVKQKVKIRYIDPLFNGKRMSAECKIAKKMIEKNLSYDTQNYSYIEEIKEF